MRAAIYARVSSQGQRERHTIENQLRVLPGFVASQGWTLVDTYVDDGRSAATGKLDARDGFARLVRDADARRFDVVAVVDIDRLTRTDDLEERARILGPFQRNGIQIVTPSGGALDLRTMLGELYVTMQALVASEEQKKRKARILAGRDRSLSAGRKPCGPTPFGLAFDTETGAWSLDPVEAPLVRELFARVLAGESCVAIARDFADRGARAPRNHWNSNVAWRIVRSRHVLGTWCSDRKRRVLVDVPALVDEATWLTAQQRLQEHGRRGLRRTRHVYLIEGLAVCGVCGRPVAIRSGVPAQRGRGPQPAAYVCRSYKLDRGVKRCTAAPVLVADLDRRVWSAIAAKIASTELAEALRQRAAERSRERRDWAADLAGYRAHLARLDKVEAALLGRFRRGTIGEVAMDTELAAHGRERAAVQAQIETARAAIAAAGKEAPDDDPQAWVGALRELARSTSPEDRQRVVRSLVKPGSAVLAGHQLRMTLLVEPRAAISGVASCVRDATRSMPDEGLKIRLVA